MNFKVYVVVEVPIIDKKYELLIPIDRRIHDVIELFKATFPELKMGYYVNHQPNLYNKFSGELYDMNLVIKNSNIKTGTRLLLI